MVSVTSSRSERELGTSPWAVPETVLQIVTPTPGPTQGECLFFQNFMLVRTSYVICWAQCKMKMQNPLFRNDEDQDRDSLALSQMRALLSSGASGGLQPAVFHKASCHCGEAEQGSLSPCKSFFQIFQRLFCFSIPWLCFVSFSGFLVVKVKHPFCGSIFSQGTASQSPSQFCFECLVRSKVCSSKKEPRTEPPYI